MKIKLAYTLALFALPVLANTPPEITNVRASQRTDTKLVDIYYDAADADGDLLKVRIEISDNDGVKYSVPAFSLTGDIGEGIAAGKDKHIVWDAGTDWDGEYSDQMRVKVYAIDAQGFPGLEWGNEVPPGGFLMGQDGGAEGSGPSRHVNINWSYWLSKYEITNQQYCEFLNSALAAGVVRRSGTESVYSVMGSQVMPQLGGSYLLINLGDDKDIRWNVNNFEVVGNYSNFPVRVTWYGAMMFAHFYGYDLPTEAEWEKAARGPDNDDQDEHLIYPWGNSVSGGYLNYAGSGDPYGDHGTTPVGYYDGNQTPVGPDVINGYGLYDVAGNVCEWTLSTYQKPNQTGCFGIERYPQQDSLLDECNMPAYGVGGSAVAKGGCWNTYPDSCRTYYRWAYPRDYYDWTYGFRVVRRVNGDRPTAVKCFVDFESWPSKTTLTQVTVNDNGLDWTLDSYAFVWAYSGDAYSGEQYLYNRYGYSMKLTLPKFDNQLVEVRMKVKNTTNGTREIALYCGDATEGYSYRSVSVPAHSDYYTISISPTKDAKTYYLQSYEVYIDDLEVWTIPRTK